MLKLCLVMLLLISTSNNIVQATQLRANLLEKFVDGQEQSWGLFQHDEKSALLVASIRGRFGLHRYDLADKNFETLKVIEQFPVFDPLDTPVPIVRFFKVNALVFVLVRGVLYSTDGSRVGTKYIRDFGTSFSGGSPGVSEETLVYSMGRLDEKLIFFASDESPSFGDSRFRLMVSDGSRQGTQKSGSSLAEIGTIFSIEDQTFFFGKYPGQDRMGMWQISEGGTRLSQLPNTPADLQAPFRVAIDNNRAFFCTNNQVAMLFNKKFSYVSEIPCDYFLEKSDAGVFYNFEGDLYSLDTNSLSSKMVQLPSGFELSEVIPCSTFASLVFIAFDTVTNQSVLMSYGKSTGLKFRRNGRDAVLYLECSADRALFVNTAGYYVFNTEDNSVVRVKNLNAEEHTTTHRAFFSNTFFHENKIFLLTRRWPENLTQLESQPLKFLEISEYEANPSSIAPALLILLREGGDS